MSYFSDLAIGKPMLGDIVKHKKTKQQGKVHSIHGFTEENVRLSVIFDDGTIIEDHYLMWELQ